MSCRIAIVGGGLAGLAAAVALTGRGLTVDIFEGRKKLGGRAASYTDRDSGESIDHCQHVAMGCCTNYLDFCRRTGIADLLERYRALHFFGPDGRRSDFLPSRWAPAPLHLLRPLWSIKYLSLADKLSIARSMLRLAKTSPHDEPTQPTVLTWLQQQRQSPAAIEHFWKVVLISALAESLDRASLAAARKVFVDGFLNNRRAAVVLVPTAPLDELYTVRAAAWLCERGVAIRLEAAVAQISGAAAATGLRLADGSELVYDFVISAVPWTRLARSLAPALLAAVDPLDAFSSIASAPISSLHLWFDRPLTDLPHAVFVGRLSQWFFARRASAAATEYYCQVVISASYNLAGRERQSTIDEVLQDLQSVFPTARSARLLRSKLITEPQAVFSVRPGLDAIRPAQQTAVSNLMLAGDWTRTGWPATMEGAVRSGYLAAESVLSRLGRPEQVLVDDLPRGWLAKWL